MIELFHNFFMQALSRSNDKIQLKFTNINYLYRSILDELLNIKMCVEKKEIERIFRDSNFLTS